MKDVLGLKTKTLRMIQDVLNFLVCQGTAVRTTGGQIVLTEEFNLSPQQVAAALEWHPKVLHRYSTLSWLGLKERYRSEIIPLFGKILEYGSVQTHRRWNHRASQRMQITTGAYFPIMVSVAEYDAEGRRIQEEYVKALEHVVQRIAPIRDPLFDQNARALFGQLEKLLRSHKRALCEVEEEIASATKQRPITSGFELTDGDQEIWKRFVEDVFSLADVEESREIFDVLRIDLFRNRPQLFELWTLIAIMKVFRWTGYDIELLSSKTIDTGRIIWHLSYGRSKTAVARLCRERDQSEYYLYYQLWRRKPGPDLMPDIVLMPSEKITDRPVWIIDPKHSERRGYTLKDYETVGKRYYDAFKPKRVWLSEYFERTDLSLQNPIRLTPEIRLIYNVSPDGQGYDLLVSELAEVHGSGSGTAIAVIDISGSFASNLDRVKDHLTRLMHGGLEVTAIVWFADQVVHARLIHGSVIESLPQPPAGLGAGTRFRPVLELLESLCDWVPFRSALKIYSDQKFDDISIYEATERLRRYGEPEFIDFSTNRAG